VFFLAFLSYVVEVKNDGDARVQSKTKNRESASAVMVNKTCYMPENVSIKLVNASI